MINIDIDFNEFESNLQAASTSIGFSAGSVVKAQADEIMEESKKQVPSETGTILSTAFVEENSSFMRGEASFGYSGQAINPKTGESASDYMVAVHERLDAVHPNGKAKFLEDPVNDFMENMEATLGEKVADMFASLFRR